MRKILELDGSIINDAIEPSVESEELLKWYQSMIQLRLLDQKGIKLQRQGRVGFHIFTTGQEAHIGAAAALNNLDWIFPAYREHGAAIYRDMPLEEIINHLFANDLDINKGRRLPGLFGNKKINFVNPSAPIGTQIIHATGAAYYASQINPEEVNIVFFGDGATSSSDFHSGLNFAGVYKTPTIFICMNNQFAISVPLEKQTASNTIADKAIAYGIKGEQVDGNDILAMYSAVKDAIKHAQNGNGPTLIEAFTYRMGPHTSSDDPSRYRPDEEVEEWKLKDPIERFKKYLIRKDLISEEENSIIYEHYDKKINELIEIADSRPKPKLETMFTDVYDTLPGSLLEQWEEVKFFTEED